MDDSGKSNRGGIIGKVEQVSESDTALAIGVLERFAQQDITVLLLQAVIIPGERTHEGRIITAVTIPWLEIVKLLCRDPAAAYTIPPRKWEEIIAGAYKKAGFEEVTLTPQSGDHGRDVIAVKRGLGSIRIIAR